MTGCLHCRNCQAEAAIRQLPVLDHAEIIAEYSDGTMVTVPSSCRMPGVFETRKNCQSIPRSID